LHRIYAISAHFRPVRAWAGALKTSMERDLRAVVSPVSEGRFRTLLSVLTNLANLNLNAAVMQQRRLRRLILYLPAALYLYNYIIRCTPHNRCTILSYILFGIVRPWCVLYDHLAWAGSTLLILIKRQCKSLSVGVSAIETLLPRLFCFHKFWVARH